MQIQDLPLQSDIILEVDRGDSSFCVRSKVLEYFSDGIAIAPIYAKGTVLNIGVRPFSTWKYHVYACVGKEKRRISWKNVQTEMIHTASVGDVYYLRTYAFAKESVSSERRTDTRYPVDVQGLVRSGDMEFAVKINDVSSMGLSFWMEEGQILSESNLTLRFSDDVHGNLGAMELFCQVARRVGRDGRTLVGCRISKYNNAYVSYIRYLNRLTCEEKNEAN